MSTQDVIAHYLEGLGVSLWPDVAFDLTDPKERAKAAEWFTKEVKAVLTSG